MSYYLSVLVLLFLTATNYSENFIHSLLRWGDELETNGRGERLEKNYFPQPLYHQLASPPSATEWRGAPSDGAHGYDVAGTFEKHRHGKSPVPSDQGIWWALGEWREKAGSSRTQSSHGERAHQRRFLWAPGVVIPGCVRADSQGREIMSLLGSERTPGTSSMIFLMHRV